MACKAWVRALVHQWIDETRGLSSTCSDGPVEVAQEIFAFEVRRMDEQLYGNDERRARCAAQIKSRDHTSPRWSVRDTDAAPLPSDAHGTHRNLMSLAQRPALGRDAMTFEPVPGHLP
ncbi:unnamed protein product [Lampetra fluviatilis]